MTAAAPTAARLGFLSCHICGMVSRGAGEHAHVCCPRCGAHLHYRKQASIQRTWALLLASAIMFVPANLLPIMTTTSFLGAQSDTIMSGVIYLWTSGSWPLAIIVFVASIMVPLLKILALGFLLVTVQRRSAWRPDERARLYRVIELVGRWSMLDIFVVTLLVALVRFSSLAIMEPRGGALAFAGVVILTMFAAMTFDPRLIWDSVEKKHG
jgi:paraquat-inducible protein A